MTDQSKDILQYVGDDGEFLYPVDENGQFCFDYLPVTDYPTSETNFPPFARNFLAPTNHPSLSMHFPPPANYSVSPLNYPPNEVASVSRFYAQTQARADERRFANGCFVLLSLGGAYLIFMLLVLTIRMGLIIL